MEYDLSFFTKTNLSWLKNNTIYLTLHGSHAYGTNISTSDIDYRGIAIAPKEYYFGFNKNFDQAVFTEPDCQIFELKKFFNLAIACNPNVLELLFIEPSDRIITHPIMKRLFDNREKFLSKRAKYTFCGYARSQLRRINTHYRNLQDAPDKKPERKDFHLSNETIIPQDQIAAANAAIAKKLDQWNIDLSRIDADLRLEIEQEITRTLEEIGASSIYIAKNDLWKEAALSVGLSPNLIELLKNERKYADAKRKWDQYQQWIKSRNEVRAELEKSFGYDTKHALHLIRLLRMCKEILQDGKLIVKRHDASELLEIRNGKYTYDELIKYSEELEADINDLFDKSKLPDSPDREFLDKLCIDMISTFLEVEL